MPHQFTIRYQVDGRLGSYRPRLRLYQGDAGVRLEILVSDPDGLAVDLSGVACSLTFRRPDGTMLERTTGYLPDGRDGLVAYTLEDGDLDRVGTWSFRLAAGTAVYEACKLAIHATLPLSPAC